MKATAKKNEGTVRVLLVGSPQERGRKRKYCGRSCQGKAYRARQGKHDRAWHKKQREEQRILALPLTERVFDLDQDRPLHVLSDGSRVYRCLTCGEVYQTKRKTKNGYYRYCSHNCALKAEYHWQRAEDALIVLQQQHSRRSWPILARMNEGKLPGLCPVCGLPFEPNTGKVGRPRKYCSKQCSRVAYEQRWRTRNWGGARRHRFRHCAECGEKFDRTDSLGRRVKRFCSRDCTNKTTDRNRYLREKGLKAPYRPKAKAKNPGGRRKIQYNQVRRDGFDPKTGWPVAIAARVRALGLDGNQGKGKAKTSQREAD
jgi:endogenous inhibitor of DNA gyrase (YacG/DUF329 family)